MRINRGLIQKAVASLKNGDDSTVTSLLKDITVSDVMSIKKLAGTKIAPQKDSNNDKYTQPVFLDSGNVDSAQNSTVSESINLSHGTNQDQLFRKELTNNSPVLRAFQRESLINGRDLLSLVPKGNKRDIGLKEIIKGRFSGRLVPTGDYFMLFNDFNSAKTYLSEVNKYDRRLNGNFISFEFVPDVSLFLRFMFSPILPDMKYFPELLTLAFEQTGFKNGKETAEEKKRAVSTFNDYLVKSRLTCVRMSSDPSATVIRNLNESFLLKKAADENIKLAAKRSFKFINRWNCVIFRNVPRNMNPRVIKNFMWDLKWYEVEELCIRKTTKDLMHGLDTYVLVFETRKDALKCVNKCNNQHLLYNDQLPIVEAELLDDML